MPSRTSLQEHLSALADPTRGRILFLLDEHELTVSELCVILQLPQSTVSRHLKALADSDWVTSRAEGTSHFYSVVRDSLDPAARGLWNVVREHVGPTTAARHDRHRLNSVLAARRTTSQEFFASSAGQWDRVREELFGDSFHLIGLLGLVDDRWTVGDLGCGTGQVTAAVAPFVERVIAVDGSPAMLKAAEERLQGLRNVTLHQGELEALPLPDASLDAATLILVLHHLGEPDRAIGEVARVLKPSGRVLIVDMLPHDREAYRQQMGHVWLGFAESQVSRSLTGAGFDGIKMRPLPAATRARGPMLFAATARKGDTKQHGEVVAADVLERTSTDEITAGTTPRP